MKFSYNVMRKKGKIKNYEERITKYMYPVEII